MDVSRSSCTLPPSIVDDINQCFFHTNTISLLKETSSEVVWCVVMRDMPNVSLERLPVASMFTVLWSLSRQLCVNLNLFFHYQIRER